MAFSKLQTKFYYYHFFLALLILKYAIFCILELRQYLYISSPDIPKDLQGYITQEVYDRLASTEMEYFRYGFYESFAHCTIFILTFFLGLLPRAWNAFGRWCDGRKSLSRFLGPDKVLMRSFIFYILYCLLRAFVFAPLLLKPRELATRDSTGPQAILSIWDTKYLLNMKGFFSVVYDLLFGFLLHITQTKPLWLPIVIMIPFLAFLETLANIILPALLPTLVDIMKKLEKAEGGKVFEVDPAFLKPLIELARKLKFPTERIIPMPLFQNAGVAGVGRYAVMLIGDGLKIFLQLTDAEMLAVVGHELGHWILNHTLYICILNMVLYSCYTAIVIYLMRNKAFYMSFDIETDPQLPIGVGLILITGFFQLFTFFIQPFLNYFRHICEYQADAFSVGLGFGGELLSGMMKLHTGGNALAQPIYGIFLHTHPVYSARVQAIAEKIASIRG